MEFIEIRGEMHPMHFGFTYVNELMEKHDAKTLNQLVDVLQNFPVKDLPSVVKNGFDTGATIAGKTPPFSKKEVDQLLEEFLWLGFAALEVLSECITRPKGAKKKDAETSDNGEVVKDAIEAEGN